MQLRSFNSIDMFPTFHADFRDLVNDERIHRVLFLFLIGTYVYTEAKSWWHVGVQSRIQDTTSLIQRNRFFYAHYM